METRIKVLRETALEGALVLREFLEHDDGSRNMPAGDGTLVPVQMEEPRDFVSVILGDESGDVTGFHGMSFDDILQSYWDDPEGFFEGVTE